MKKPPNPLATEVRSYVFNSISRCRQRPTTRLLLSAAGPRNITRKRGNLVFRQAGFVRRHAAQAVAQCLGHAIGAWLDLIEYRAHGALSARILQRVAKSAGWYDACKQFFAEHHLCCVVGCVRGKAKQRTGQQERNRRRSAKMSGRGERGHDRLEG